MNIMNVFVIV